MKNKFFFFTIIALFTIVTINAALGQESRTVEKSFSLSKDGSVFIDNYKGSIRIETWNRDKVELEVKIEADDNDKYAEEKVKYTEIQIKSSKSSLRIKTDYDEMRDKLSFFRGMFSKNIGNMPLVHYSIKMPATADLRIKDYKSESEIRDVHAFVEFETYKGSLDMKGLEGGINLETYKGDIKIRFDKFTERSTFETYKGNIEITLPDRAGFDLNAKLGRRADFNTDFELQTSIKGRRKKDSSFQAEFNGGGTELRIETERGEIRLRRD